MEKLFTAEAQSAQRNPRIILWGNQEKEIEIRRRKIIPIVDNVLS
jgi:hypothetical protein